MKALLKYLTLFFLFFSIPTIGIALPKCGKTYHNCTGSITYKNGDKYYGDWQNNKRHGFGDYFYKNGNKYEGYWVNDNMAGVGRFTYANGEKYTGYFLDNKRHGKGTYTYNNGNKYVGDWVNGKRTGKGIFTFADGTKQEGVFKDSKFLYAEKLDKKTRSSTSLEWGKSPVCRMLKRLAEEDSTKGQWELGIGSAKRFLNLYPNSDVKDCLTKAVNILASKDFTPKPKFIVLDANEYNSSKDIGWNRKYNNPQQNEKLKISLPAMKFLATNEKISIGAFNRNFLINYNKYAGLENLSPCRFKARYNINKYHSEHLGRVEKVIIDFNKVNFNTQTSSYKGPPGFKFSCNGFCQSIYGKSLISKNIEWTNLNTLSILTSETDNMWSRVKKALNDIKKVCNASTSKY